MFTSQSNPECGQQSADPSEACSKPGVFNGGVLQRVTGWLVINLRKKWTSHSSQMLFVVAVITDCFIFSQ